MNKLKTDMPIIVEGKYDKIKLSAVVDGIIITTGGFEIYKNREKLALIRSYAKKTGVVILTDSDGAGFQIRNHLKSCINDGKIINVYIPDIFGKERRKDKPSKEGKLGVEGIDTEILAEKLREAGVLSGDNKVREPWATKAMLAEDGLSGGEGSSLLREKLCAALGLPARMTSKALLESLNALYDEEKYRAALGDILRG